MRTALLAEWTKLATVPGTGWLLLATIALTAGLGSLVTAAADCPAIGCGQDAAKLSLCGIVLAQAVVAVLAVMTIGSEYSTGMIQVSLTAMPRRARLLTAKALVLGALVLTAAAAGVLGSLLIGRIVLPGNGFTAVHGYPPLSLTNGPILRAVIGSVLYLGLIALLGLGIGTAVREPAAAIGIVLGLLYLSPILVQVVTDPDWHRRLQQISPMNAGLAVQATTDLGGLPIGPWAGLGVLALWAAGSLATGGFLFSRRDA